MSKVKKPKKVYWIQWCYRERMPDKSRTFTSQANALKWAKSVVPKDCTFYYLMTTDPWGEVFVDCIRPNENQALRLIGNF